MADKIDLFWEIFESVSGGTGDITDALDAIAKSDRTKVESYFSNVIDQISFGTPDWNRLRKFLIDLYASHRTLASASKQTSDPHSLMNSDLDELFRSFGYPHSTTLRGFDENPLEQKVQFFLDLVNLYKVKGTPQSLVDVLQYYGVTELDIYEFFLKLEDKNTLIFDGKAVAGTTVNPSNIQLPYANLTSTDPHWLYTAQQILQLNQQLNINLPSKTPYLGVQPIVDVDGAEMSILVRKVQDQYDYYSSTSTLPTANAEITFIGEVRSLLELYLSTVYMFNDLFTVGADATSYICYDGTNTKSVDIITEYETITQPPTSRAGQKAQLERYYDVFTRYTPTNFLVDGNSAGTWLNTIAPDIKLQLDGVGEPLEVLYSLLKDLAIWVRSNIGYGFVNFGFILFGINEFFNELKPVIDFFKPYRARLLLLESLQVRNRLFNTIIIEDEISFDATLQFHDFMTGDSIACCGSDVDIDSTTPSYIEIDSTTVLVCEGGKTTKCEREFIGSVPLSMTWRGLWADNVIYSVNDVVPDFHNNQYICIQQHIAGLETKPYFGANWTLYWSQISEIVCTDSTSNVSYYSRETYDCGSAFDYGAVVDDDISIESWDLFHDRLRCPDDASAFVVSEILSYGYGNSQDIDDNSDLVSISFPTPFDGTNADYSIGLSIKNETSLGSIYNYIVTNKTVTGFDVVLSSPTDSSNYCIDWEIVYDSTDAGVTNLIPIDSTEVTIVLPSGFICPAADYSVMVSMINNVDPTSSIYGFDVVEKTATSFKVRFSSPLDSGNYFVDWSVCTSGNSGYYNIPNAVSEIIIPITEQSTTMYPLIANIVAEGSPNSSSIYSTMIVDKSLSSFTIELSSPTDSTNYYVSWVIPSITPANINEMTYYQSGGFRDFDGVPNLDSTAGAIVDSEGTFDCTHGFDLVFITVEEDIPVPGERLLQENSDRLLQENYDRILL